MQLGKSKIETILFPSGVPAFRRSGIPAFRYTGVPAFRRSCILAFRHIGGLALQRSGVPVFRRRFGVPAFRYSSVKLDIQRLFSNDNNQNYIRKYELSSSNFSYFFAILFPIFVDSVLCLLGNYNIFLKYLGMFNFGPNSH